VCGDQVAGISSGPDRDQGLREQLTKLAQERPRFGYRRLGMLLDREGEHVNHKRLFRVYRQSGLSVKRNRRKKLVRSGISQRAYRWPEKDVRRRASKRDYRRLVAGQVGTQEHEEC
jgi:hypothetical protein